ncbi:MAG: hypothetical protein U0840_22390 [Gemmataceae bacterium]
MFVPFFVLAGQSPTRQATFHRVVTAHLLVLSALALGLIHQGRGASPQMLAQVLLTAGIIEGALLLGWRLTQIPKSQALEFLLVSPLQPAPLFLGEAFVGLAQLLLVTLAGLPVLAMLAAVGHLDPVDLLPLTFLPFTWGAITGLGLTVWAYEPRGVRMVGEMLTGLGIVVYLVVGVLAGEKLRQWVELLPQTWKFPILWSAQASHEHSPFGTMHYWMTTDMAESWRRVLGFELLSLAGVALLLLRAAFRLQGHFHERHYDPVRDVSDDLRPAVGNRPLAWWAVKRVTEYSGRINLWLAGGFCLLYALYLVAEPIWPTWMGRRIFQMCDAVGGAAALAAALVVLSAVPAAFQYGLWDSSVQDRCRRLELLLLTELQPRDYWDAAFAAAWRRGRGYLGIALGLWLAAWLGGRLSLAELLTSVAAAALLWGLYFTLGFRAFARGAQANGLGMLLTLGLPLLAWGLGRAGLPLVGAWLPPGMVYRAGTGPVGLAWLVGPVLVAALTLGLARLGLAECDARLREWYDRNHGNKMLQ